MEKRKLHITKTNLDFFSMFCKKNKIVFKETSFLRIYTSTIYFGKGTSGFLGWEVNALKEKQLKILVSMINIMLEDTELVYKRER